MHEIEEHSDEHSDNQSAGAKSSDRNLEEISNSGSRSSDHGYDSNMSSMEDDHEIEDLINEDPNPEELIKINERKQRKKSRRDSQYYDLEDNTAVPPAPDSDAKYLATSVLKRQNSAKAFQEDEEFRFAGARKFMSFKQYSRTRLYS